MFIGLTTIEFVTQISIWHQYLNIQSFCSTKNLKPNYVLVEINCPTVPILDNEFRELFLKSWMQRSADLTIFSAIGQK